MDDTKVLITSNNKKDAVRKLFCYWSTKTTFMRKRNDPTAVDDPIVQEQTNDYLKQHTKLNSFKFWNSLSNENQAIAISCFSIQEVFSVNKKEMIGNARNKSIVYICLNGTAKSKNASTDVETIYHKGDVFGSIDNFNDVVENQSLFNNLLDKDGIHQIIDFSHGTFLRLELKDLHQHVLKPKEKSAEEIAKENKRIDSEIAEKAWEDLTEDDKFYIRVYKKTKEQVNPHFFSFIDSYRMIPKNASMPSYKYYHEASINREIFLDEKDPIWVFVIIDGSVRIEVSMLENDKSEHSLSLINKKKGSKTMSLNRKTLPLMHLDSGSVVCLQPEVFTLGRYDYIQDETQIKIAEDSAPIDTHNILPPINNNTSYNANTINNNQNNKSSNIKSSRGILSNKVRNRIAMESRYDNDNQTINTNSHSVSSLNYIPSTDIFHPNPFPPLENPISEERKYNLKMVFTKYTTYLAVPFRKFVKILNKKEGKVHSVLPTIANEIKWYLNNSNQIVVERIKRILPWIMGNNINFVPKVIPPKQTKLDFYTSEIIAKDSIDIDYNSITIGSFTKTTKISNKKAQNRASYYSRSSLLIPSPIKKLNKYLPHTPEEIAIHNKLLDLRKSHKADRFSASKIKSNSSNNPDMNNPFLTNTVFSYDEEEDDDSDDYDDDDNNSIFSSDGSV